MMVETWRLMRDHFWIEDMGGVDWDDVLERYLPLVDRIATRDDLSEVLWEMIGELGSSHAYERMQYPPAADRPRRGVPRRRPRPRRRRPLADRAACCPASRRCPRRARRCARPARTSATATCSSRSTGARSAAAGPAPLLAGLAGKPVELTVSRDGVDAHGRRVVPTDDETPIRYQDWVSGAAPRCTRQRRPHRLRARAGHDVHRLGGVQPRPARARSSATP